MAQDLVTLFNLALSAVGTRSAVASPDEASREAEICRRWYDTVRRHALKAAPWSCAREVVGLAQLAVRSDTTAWSSSDPEPPWTYLFGAPTNMLHPRHLESYMNFVLTQRNDAQAFLTDDAQPVLTYTKDQLKPSSWDSDFWLVMVHGLAAAIAMNLHGKPARAKVSIDAANEIIMVARATNANQDQEQYDSIPDWLVARGARQGSSYSRFIYPHGPLFSGAALV
jgi:hypothetical protein